MLTTLGLFTCALAMGQSPTAGQSPDRTEVHIAPQYTAGLELVYSGTYTEKSLIPNVQHRRDYRLEATLFFLESSPRQWEVAILTVLSPRPARSGAGVEPPVTTAASVRLAMGRVDLQGKLTDEKGARMLVTLDGPPTLECGALLEFPVSRLRRDQPWEIAEAGRPPLSWQLVGTEPKNGTVCLRIAGLQQSDDWDRPRADHTAWRRRDTLWVPAQLGFPLRVERVIERRAPARRDPTHLVEVVYDLESRLRFPGKLYLERETEIVKAFKFQEDARPLLSRPVTYRPQLDALVQKIGYHLDRHSPTPYRQAILALQKRIESARKGEIPPEEIVDVKAEPVPAVKIGQRAPDFVASEIAGGKSIRLYRHLGRPMLLFFYNPATDSGRQLLNFARTIYDKYGNAIVLMPLALTSDASKAIQQHAELRLPFPVLDGSGLRASFGVDATPRLVVLDPEGVVRVAYTGWGLQPSVEIEEELRRWLPRQ